MDFKVIYTKAFNGYLRALQQQGQKKVVQAVRAAISEAGMNGEIRSLPRTKHGESRIPDVEKYDLSDAYRLVVQLVDGVAKVRAFLFVGSHDDSDRWLDAHRNYRWVKSNTDGTLEFVQVTQTKEERYVPADRVDLESPEELLNAPLLRVLATEDRKRLRLPDAAEHLAFAVTSSDYERDADGILIKLDELAGWEKASVVFDLISHAHSREWSELRRRISLLSGESTVAQPAEAVAAMLAPENSESFITFDEFDDSSDYFVNHTLADWMLFLHPDQKKVAEKDFRGPARLRGISGSGKTCVLVHRARHLAKKYRLPVLLVTLTESMRKLLDKLIDDLCGVERFLISTMTMSAVAKQVVQELHPFGGIGMITQERQERLIATVAEQIRSHPALEHTAFRHMNDEVLQSFLRDEIAYVRGRLRSTELDDYLDAHLFQRRGRGLRLNEASRRAVRDCILTYQRLLTEGRMLDHEGIVAEALQLLESPNDNLTTFRCILCDEVQDLSQLDIALMAKLPSMTGERIATTEDGLFLAGDGAQSIYKRGFTLRQLGIDIGGRSFTLRKNYRNTYEILKAAFGLVAEYEFADVDEDNIVKPSAPEYAKRHGARPIIIRCSSTFEEAMAVAGAVKSLLTMGQIPGQVCIIGPSAKMRDEVQRALTRSGVDYAELRQDVDYESDRVKVSTIESAKGHEFASVFIMGLVEGVLPNAMLSPDEIPREAARLYVAMTRARESLTITYSPWASFPASRFLLAIQSDCDEAQYRNGEVKKLA